MKIKLVDLHSDLPTADGLNGNNLNIARQNAKSGIFTVNAIYKGNRSLPEGLEIAKNYADSRLPIAFEDGCYQDFLEEGSHLIDEQVEKLAYKLCSFNPLYISLGWNYDNLLVGGCAQNGELTKLGEIFISCLNDNKVAVDLAHSNKKSFYQVADRAKKILCSHTAFEWIYPHRRNLDEEQVKLILNRGGVIGLIGVGHFLSGIKNAKGRESAFFYQLEGYIKKFGVNGLAIGSDFYGSDAPVFADGDYAFAEILYSKLSKLGIKSDGVERVLYKNAGLFFGINV
ncbi:MAG: hypothetical protein E7339_07495 [Clostridiales bacterium]|nr:hypothetical protein [Clostridiales bacterium]